MMITLGDVGTSHTELMNAAMPFFVALFSQRRKRWSAAHLNLLHQTKNI